MSSITSTVRLLVGTRFVMRNEIYEVAYLDASMVRYSSVQGGRPRSFPLDSFWQLEEEGVISFLGEEVPPDSGVPGIHQLTELQRNEMKRRLHYVKTLLLQPRNPHSRHNRVQTIAYVAKEIGDQKPPSLPTLSRWAASFCRSGMRPHSLIPRHDRKGGSHTRQPLDVELLVGATIRSDYLKRERLTGEQIRCNIVGRMKQQGLITSAVKPPSQSTIYRRLKALDPYLVAIKRFGKTVADQRFRAAGQSMELSRPMENVMIDGHLIDLLVIDSESGEVIGRPYLVCIFDVYTRCVVGWYISLMPFCATTALAAIKHMCSRNPQVEPGGVPEKLTPDNGLDFASSATRYVLQKLGIHILPAKVRSPDDKAHLERFFRTVNMQLVHMIPGTTFSNPADKGEYDSKKRAACTLEELRTLFDRWLRTVYEVSIHTGTGRAPRIDWKENQALWPISHYSAFEMDVIARTHHSRVISGGRVLVDHLYYKSDVLSTWEHRGMRDVSVAVDEMDLSYVYVSHASDPKSLVRADAVKQRYTHELTKYEHDEAKKTLKEKGAADLTEVGEYAYEVARWELWQELHKLKSSRSKRRLAALKESLHQRKGKALEVRQEAPVALLPAPPMTVGAAAPNIQEERQSDLTFPVTIESGASSRNSPTHLELPEVPSFDILDI